MKMIDMTGERFGKLIVLEKTDQHTNNNKILWKCKCDCGAECLKTRDYLIKPSSKDKACSLRCSTAILPGTKFGRLTVLEQEKVDKGETTYKCQCNCGNIISVSSSHLKHGHTKSCGCYLRDRMSIIGKLNSNPSDITGQQFGLLTAIEPTEKRRNRAVIWKCQCQCGNFHYATVNNLKSGCITRCSQCFIKSKGEEKIIQILQEAKIPFEREKIFDTCIFKDTKGKARFDFYVDNKYLIEFDGIQHFKATGWNTKSNLIEIQKRDQYKNEWCKNNNISLIRIPYTKFDTLVLEDLLLQTTKYLTN